jgi:hypothetical protein
MYQRIDATVATVVDDPWMQYRVMVESVGVSGPLIHFPLNTILRMRQQWVILLTSVHQISSEIAVYISTVILAAVWE